MSAFDHKLAFHCAPALAAIKPASLISVRWEEWDAMREGIARNGRAFVGRQIDFRRLACCQRRVLLLVNRRDLLARRLFSVYKHARCFFCRRALGGEEIQNIQ